MRAGQISERDAASGAATGGWSNSVKMATSRSFSGAPSMARTAWASSAERLGWRFAGSVTPRLPSGASEELSAARGSSRGVSSSGRFTALGCALADLAGEPLRGDPPRATCPLGDSPKCGRDHPVATSCVTLPVVPGLSYRLRGLQAAACRLGVGIENPDIAFRRPSPRRTGLGHSV